MRYTLGPQPELQGKSAWGRTLPEAIEHWISSGTVREADSGCWEWTATLRSGYAQAYLLKRKCAGHRLFYIHFRSDIPSGLDLDHLCRNRACVNPWHLEPVTRSVNLLRGEQPNHPLRMRTHCPQGHPYDEANTARRNGRRHCRACHNARRRVCDHELTPENTITRSDGVRWCRTCREAWYASKRKTPIEGQPEPVMAGQVDLFELVGGSP